MQMFWHCFTIWWITSYKNSQMVNNVVFLPQREGGYKWLVLTPIVAGSPRQARGCSSSAAVFHAAPKWKLRHLWWRGKPSAPSSPPQTASSGTLWAASETGPETRSSIECNQGLMWCQQESAFGAEAAVQFLKFSFYWGQTVGACRVRRHTFKGLQPRYLTGVSQQPAEEHNELKPFYVVTMRVSFMDIAFFKPNKGLTCVWFNCCDWLILLYDKHN